MNSKKEKADLDWKNLPFDYVKTDFNVRYRYKNGAWSGQEISSDENISMHVASGSLHYGQEAFEGLKAFETKDGRVVVFRPEENSKRLNRSAERIYMPQVPEKLFIEAVESAVKANLKYVPPYGTGASLYIRPLLIGVGPRVGLGPSPEYLFVVFVNPVGPYYKGGFKPVKALVVDEYDRAAPNGVGDCKVGGNYAAGLRGAQYAKDKGYPIVLYLDPREKKYIDEFGTSNFIGIKKSSYITPSSNSILPSITNASLAGIAESIGLSVERRPIDIAELEGFDEVGAVGTAAVITPVNLVHYKGKDFRFGPDDSAGKMMTALYDKFTGIQNGDIEDSFGWLYEIK